MNKQEFINELENILEVDANTLTTEHILADIPAWDSLAFLSVIAMADEEFNILIEGEKLEQVTHVQNLIELVEDQLTTTA